MTELSSYLLKGLVHLQKDDKALSEVLVKYKGYLAARIHENCIYYKLEPDDAFQQLIPRLMKFSKDYEIPLYLYKGVICKEVGETRKKVKLSHKTFKESTWVSKISVDKVRKLSYTNFIKLKITQELSNIKEGLFRQREGFEPGVDSRGSFPSYVSLDSEEGESLFDYADPERRMIAKETLSASGMKLSRPAEKFLKSVAYESSRCDNHLVKRIKVKRQRLRFARREVKNAIFGSYKGSKVSPIHFKASVVRW